MAGLDWRKCKKAGSDGSNYNPFEKKRPWQDQDRWGYGSMSLPELRRELLSELRRELARLRRKIQT